MSPHSGAQGYVARVSRWNYHVYDVGIAVNFLLVLGYGRIHP